MKKKLLALAVCGVMLFATACGGGGTATTTAAPSTTQAAATEGETSTELKTHQIAKEDLKVGFVYIGDINDNGFTQAFDNGRIALEGMGIECTYIENVPENADCERAIRDLVDQGCNVIYTCSFGFMDYTETVAKDHPEVLFSHFSGYKTLDNMNTFMGKAIQPRYLSGIVAGLQTKTNKIGYVAAMPIPECIRGINAFTLGVQSVNPDATVEVIWSNTWYDPAVEKQAAMELLNKGCDVISQHQDSTACQVAAEEKGVWAIGYNSPTYDAAPKAYLTAPLYNWASYFENDIQKVIDGTWTGSKYWGGMDDGLVSLDALSANCTPEAQAKVDEATKAIMEDGFNPFSGPIYNQAGELVVAEGEVMAEDDIWNMSYYVKGVVGNLE